MGELGLYRPGDSVLHRMPAGLKLAALFVLAVSVYFLGKVWWVPLVVLAVIFALYVCCGLGLGAAIRQLRPMIWILLFMLVANWIARDLLWSIGVVATVCSLVSAAALVTLTTRTFDLVETVVKICRPLKRVPLLGRFVDPERVGLAMALGIRCVPLVAGLARQVREAQIARGNLKSVRAFAAPLLISAIRSAGDMGDALIARGVDD